MPAQQINQAKRELKRAYKVRQDEIADAIKGLQEEAQQINEELASLEGKSPESAAPSGPGKKARRKGRKAGGKAKAAKGSAGKSKAAAPSAATSTTSESGAGTAPKKRRKRRGGTRAEQVLRLVKRQPGLIGTEIAAELKMKPNYLYRVLDELKAEGKVHKGEGGKYTAA